MEATEVKKKILIRTIQKLDYDTEDIYSLAVKYPPSGWKTIFEEEDVKSELKDIAETLKFLEAKGERWFPPKKDLFRAFHLTPLREVKVVIVGQDPYAQYGSDSLPRPTGLSFSVRKTDTIPASLHNIFHELTDEYPEMKVPQHGCLESWALQGVLLLNSSLTVRVDDSGSHRKTWDGFIAYIIQRINKINPKCIYVLWGRESQRLKQYIGTKPIILEAAHPSSRNTNGKFLGNGHFKKINELLKANGSKEINWELV